MHGLPVSNNNLDTHGGFITECAHASAQAGDDTPVCHQLIQEAAQGPQVTSEGVLLVLPKLRRHVVGCANLRICNTLLDHLCNAEIANLSCNSAVRAWGSMKCSCVQLGSVTRQAVTHTSTPKCV